jgi:hypothetical protein
MGLHTDVLRIPWKLHYLLCGRKRATLQPIIDETLVNIYFPSPFTNNDTTSASSYDDENLDNDQPPIFITGDATSVARSKEMLTKLANQKVRSSMCCQSVSYVCLFLSCRRNRSTTRSLIWILESWTGCKSIDGMNYTKSCMTMGPLSLSLLLAQHTTMSLSMLKTESMLKEPCVQSTFW